MKTRILNVEPENYCEEARAILETFSSLDLVSLDRATLLQRIGNYDGLVVRLGHHINTELFDAARKLKVIATATTGLNHIDLAQAQRHGVAVLSLKGERQFLDTVTATAEHTWGMLLSLVRHLPQAYNHVLEGGWNRNLFKGIDLKGKTLGIIGLGRLGTMVARFGLAFGMKVLASDIITNSGIEDISFVCKTELLSKADIVTLHVALDKEAKGMLGQEEFANMKRGSWLINTSRGELIDEKALLEALLSGHLAGAALDVLVGEYSTGLNWVGSHPLIAYARKNKNLLLFPHIGGATYDSMRKTEVFMANKLHHFFQK